jgi:hypothetical protein
MILGVTLSFWWWLFFQYLGDFLLLGEPSGFRFRGCHLVLYVGTGACCTSSSHSSSSGDAACVSQFSLPYALSVTVLSRSLPAAVLHRTRRRSGSSSFSWGLTSATRFVGVLQADW